MTFVRFLEQTHLFAKVLFPFGYISPAFVEDSKALPLEWLLAPKDKTLADRVPARLIWLEAHEPDVFLRDDYRQSWICLSLALKGNTEPFTVSSYTVYGVHPDKVFERLTAQRKSKLSGEYPDWFDAAGNLRPDIPKISARKIEPAGAPTPKPVAPVSSPERKRA